MQNNIHPTFDKLLSREQQEKLLNQRSKVLWFTGLSGSGKSTIAQAVEKKLYTQGYFVKALDGDNVRTGICNNLGFSIDDRTENIRRIAEVAKLFLDSGVLVLCSFVSPTIAIRQSAQDIIGAEDFIEIFVDTPLHICESRDVKGLYAKARAGEIKGFTGIDSPFEAPTAPHISLKTADRSVSDCADEVVRYVLGNL